MANSNWTTEGATLSDKTTRKEFGLTQEEIIEAVRTGKLQYRNQYMHGNPYLKLIRSEVEALVNEKYGEDYLKKKKLENELAQVNRELRGLKSKMTSLEKKRVKLLEEISD